MTWTAQITSIHDTPVPSGDKVVNVLFSDGAGRDIRRTYHMHADLIDTAQEAAQFLQVECDKLDKADQVHDDLEALLGQTITAGTLPQPLVVKRVTPYQARMALLGAGLLSTVETVVQQPGNEAAKIAWEYATVIERTSPFITALASAVGLTDEQVDALFHAASSVT